MKIKKKTFALIILGLFLLAGVAFIIASAPREVTNKVPEPVEVKQIPVESTNLVSNMSDGKLTILTALGQYGFVPMIAFLPIFMYILFKLLEATCIR